MYPLFTKTDIAGSLTLGCPRVSCKFLMRLAAVLPAAAPWSVTARGSRDHDARNTERSPPALIMKATGVRCETVKRIA